ncbi:MAG: hypothetical protein J5802_09015 [Butyrivibrio sp.]|nr:hypothetical protein [Butyrivibrio sp.]
MPEFIGFADFAKLAEIEPPLPTIEELSVSVTPLFFLEKARGPSGFLKTKSKFRVFVTLRKTE